MYSISKAIIRIITSTEIKVIMNIIKKMRLIEIEIELGKLYPDMYVCK